MSAERRQENYSQLGLGTENFVIQLNNRPDQVIKFARQLYIFEKHFLDKKGKETKNRIKENFEIIHNHIDKQFLPKTRVKSLGNIWWTQQEILPTNNTVNSENIKENTELIFKIKQVFNEAETMHKETGYYLDWFGFNRMDEIVKLLTLPDYWNIPNLVITKKQQLKIFDLGLYLDNNIPNNQRPSAVSPLIDPLVCKLQLFLVEKIKEKILKTKCN